MNDLKPLLLALEQVHLGLLRGSKDAQQRQLAARWVDHLTLLNRLRIAIQFDDHQRAKHRRSRGAR